MSCAYVRRLFKGGTRQWLLGCAVVLVVVCSMVPAVSFAGRGGYAGESRIVESTVREINQPRQTVYLMSGTLLSTNDAKLLDQLAPGMRVRAAVEENGNGQKLINRLEIIP